MYRMSVKSACASFGYIIPDIICFCAGIPLFIFGVIKAILVVSLFGLFLSFYSRLYMLLQFVFFPT
jgi:hypothetical protein